MKVGDLVGVRPGGCYEGVGAEIFDGRLCVVTEVAGFRAWVQRVIRGPLPGVKCEVMQNYCTADPELTDAEAAVIAENVLRGKFRV